MPRPTKSQSRKAQFAARAGPITPPQTTTAPNPERLPNRAPIVAKTTTSRRACPARRANQPAAGTSDSGLSSPPSSAPDCLRRGSLDISSTSTSSIGSTSGTSTISDDYPCNRISQPRIIRGPEGAIFQAWPFADRPDAPTLGDEPTRLPDGRIKPRTKREADGQLEIQWQKRRKVMVEEKVFKRFESDVYGVSKCDIDGTFHFEGVSLPEWLHAERELQDDGRPGTYIVRPGKEDFECRWNEILQLLEPFGMRLGIVKLQVPTECLGKAPPYNEYLAKNRPTSPPPKPKSSRRGRPPKTYRSRKSLKPNGSTSTPAPEASSSTPAAEPVLPPSRELMVYTMTQFLPLHVNSIHPHAPIYEVISKNKTLVPISTFAHQLDENSPNHRIPEDIMLRRGRSWSDIMQENPGGEVHYSSDNDITGELRSYLGIADPKLMQLPGNHIFDSTEKVIGIHTPYLYLGNPYTLFALHQEDYSALSLNYHHKGAPKMWRVTCPMDFQKVERLIARIRDEQPGKKLCSQHVRHSSVFVSEGALELEGIRSIAVRQNMGEMIITWPLSYHQGWNEGGNICEAIAYGSKTWRQTFVDHGNNVYRSCDQKCVARSLGMPIELKFKAPGSMESMAGIEKKEA